MSDDTLDGEFAKEFAEHVNAVLDLHTVEGVYEMSPDDLWELYRGMHFDMAFVYGRPPDEVMQAIVAGRMYESLLQRHPGRWKLFSSSLAKRKYTFTHQRSPIVGLFVHQPQQEDA